jgi:putative ABC transport system substrate-binding protein
MGSLGGAAFAWPITARAQPGPIPQIGLLDPGVPHLFAAFLEGMRDLGYEEGRNVAYVRRSTEGKAGRFPEFAAEFVLLEVDVIVTTGPAPVRAVMAATTTIPIVFAAVGDAVGAGLVQSLAHPGGNATGLSFLNTEISPKRLELLHEALPEARRIAMLCYRNSNSNDASATRDAGGRLGIELQVLVVSEPDDFEPAFQAAVAGRTEAINVLASPFFNTNRVRLSELAAKYRLPAMYETSEYVDAGGLMSYGPSLADLFRRAADFVDKILRGAKPGDLPVQQPTKIELVINLKTAKTLGLTVPASILARADDVIE